MNNAFCRLHHPTDGSLVGNEEILPLFLISFPLSTHSSTPLLCSQCHPTHPNYLNLDQLLTEVQTLSQLPQLKVKKHLSLLSMVMEKFKYISQFKQKVTEVERTIINQFFYLIDQTDEIVQQQSSNKKYIDNLMKELLKIDDLSQLKQFNLQKQQLLSKLALKKRKTKGLSLQNIELEQVQKCCEESMQKIYKSFTQIREYCMKIVEVVVNQEEDEPQSQDLSLVTKMYQRHRNYFESNFRSHVMKSTITQTEKYSLEVDGEKSNRGLYEMEKKIKRVQEKLINQIEHLSFENKNLKERNLQLKTIIKKTKKQNSQREHSLTTINSEKDIFSGKLSETQRQKKTM